MVRWRCMRFQARFEPWHGTSPSLAVQAAPGAPLRLRCPSLENASSVLQEVGRGLAKTSSARQSGLVTALRGAVTATSRGRL